MTHALQCIGLGGRSVDSHLTRGDQLGLDRYSKLTLAPMQFAVVVDVKASWLIGHDVHP
jgi:hypothetical protein